VGHPGRIGIVGGGWTKRPPRPMPVPWDGGASPTRGVVPTVTSASGLLSSPTPTTPPLAPSPAETDADSRGADLGGFWDGGGAESPSGFPLDPEDGFGEAAEPWDGAAPDPSADRNPDPSSDPEGAAAEAPVPPAEPARRVPRPPSAAGAGSGAVTGSPVETDPPAPSAVASGEGPVDGSVGEAAICAGARWGWSSEAIRLTATPLAMRTTSAEAAANPTNAPRRCSVNAGAAPDSPARSTAGP
jgi:hypothetical protein